MEPSLYGKESDAGRISISL